MDKAQADEIDLVGMLLFLRRNLVFMAVVTALSLAVGVSYVFITPAEFQSQTVFMLKKGDEGKDNASFLSRLGGMGSNMAALGIGGGGSANQDRAEFLLKSRDLSEAVAGKKEFLPKLFPDRWDAKAGKWKEGGEPSIESAAGLLRACISVTVKKGFFTLVVLVRNDPVLAKDLVEAYLSALNTKIQVDARNESTENRGYLQDALSNTLDPMVQEKIQNRIAYEIEKYMLVSVNSLDILEKPVVNRQKTQPRAKLVLLLAFMTGVLASLILVAGREFGARLARAYSLRTRE